MRKSVKREYEQDRRWDWHERWPGRKGRRWFKRTLHKRLRKSQLKHLEEM